MAWDWENQSGTRIASIGNGAGGWGLEAGAQQSNTAAKRPRVDTGARHSGTPQSRGRVGAKRPSPQSPIPSPDSLHHRTFNVAKPTNTSTTEMIQKRTITRGSGQPFNSK